MTAPVLLEAAPLHTGGDWTPVLDDDEALQVLQAQAVTKGPVEHLGEGWWRVRLLPHVRAILAVDGRFTRETPTHLVTIVREET